MKILIFLAFCVHLSAADTHSYRYFYTAVTSGINFPEFTLVGLLDGVEFEYYDSNIRKYIPKTEWMKKNEEPGYWNGQTQIAQGAEESFKVTVATAMQRFNHTTGVHTVQLMYGCERDDDGTTRGYLQYGYDGEDFVSLDLKTKTWIAPTPQALITKNKWEKTGAEANYWNGYLEKECIEWLNRHLSYGRETLEREDPPTASVFQKHSSSPEVVCHATGFFPKTVMITWQKDGEDVHEDVELRETLPNQDGSFQKRSVLTVSAEDLQKHTYTCVIQHSSLEKEMEMVLDVSKGGGSGGVLFVIGIIAGFIVVLVVIIASGVGFCIWMKKNSDGVQNVIIPGGVSVTTSMLLMVLLQFSSGRRMIRWSEDCHHWFRPWSPVEVERGGGRWSVAIKGERVYTRTQTNSSG